MTKDRRNPLNIVEAIYDPQLFGSLFKTVSSWSAWVVFLKAVFGIAMAQTELDLYRQCTGREAPPPDGAKESYAIVGRRGGKSRIVSLAAVYIAAFCDFREYLSPGEVGTVSSFGARQRASAHCFSLRSRHSQVHSRLGQVGAIMAGRRD
jgi:hypothetical protein